MNSVSIPMLTALLSLTSGCCVFHWKFGDTGVVLPGSVQYELYLRNARSNNETVDKMCKTHGNPVAIEIGNTGANMGWTHPLTLMTFRYNWFVTRLETPPSNITDRLKPYMIEGWTPSSGPRGGGVKPAAQTVPQKELAVVGFEYQSGAPKGSIKVALGSHSPAEAKTFARREFRILVEGDKPAALQGGEEDGRYPIVGQKIEDGVLELQFEVRQ